MKRDSKKDREKAGYEYRNVKHAMWGMSRK